MFVGGFGHTFSVTFFGNSFFVGDNGFGFDDRAVGEIFFQIFEANFDVQFSASGDNVLTVFLRGTDDQGIGFGKLLESVDEFGEIGGVFRLDGDSDDWRDGVFHVSDGVSGFRGGESTGFHEILIDSD